MKKSNTLKKFLILISIFILSFTTLTAPLNTHAAEGNIENTNPINIITQTDTKLIYEMEEDGKTLRYEEDIKNNKNNTKIETKVYVKENDKFKLIENFKTDIVKNDQPDSYNINQSGVSVSVLKDDPEINIDELGISTAAYGPWKKSLFPKIKLGYRLDGKKGQASYSTMLRSNLSTSNKKFNQFTRHIDSIKSWERAIVFDSTVVGLIEAGIKLKNKITLAALLNLGKKFFVPVNTVYNAFNWLLEYNRATKLFSELGGTKTTVCNWWC